MKPLPFRFAFLVAVTIVLAACSNNDETLVPATSEPALDQVVTIEGKTFTKSDLQFYSLMKKIQIEMNRHFDEENRNDYWNEQLNYQENMNVQLQNLVELYAMSLLAEEKHYDIPHEKLEKEVQKFKDGIADIEGAKSLIKDFGEGQFNRHVNEYMRQSLLRDRIVADLENEIKAENPKINNDELNYTLSQQYDALYMDQIGDLAVEVHVK